MWYSRFIPDADPISRGERLFTFAAALLSILIVALIARHFLAGYGLPMLIASMGASAVLLFATPHSRFSQPWPFVGGHLISVLIGITCAQWINDWVWAAALAIGLSIAAMQMLRCMHPPGGAAALVSVIGGEQIHAMGYAFLLMPVLLNVLTMLLMALLLNNLMPGRHYPLKDEPNLSAGETLDFSSEDLTQALRDMDAYIDVSQEDLQKIYSLARMHHNIKHLGNARCGEIMQSPVVTVEYGTELEEVWRLLQQHRISALPVTDGFEHVIGMLTLHDLMQKVQLAEEESFGEHLLNLIRRTPGYESEKPEVAGQLMRQDPLCVSETLQVAELLPLFDRHQVEHIPVINEKRKLVGMITRTTIMQRL